ncbi:MAG TPA: FAD-dependent monooxygenase [Streptosporangiaceae bacterium]|jgi:2-polyprenyl-6-methoxyphenol hydroxylase-like FAD-dependent oxidoreductase
MHRYSNDPRRDRPLRRRDDGSEYQLRAQYVVAADGASSGIRDALGYGRRGEGLLAVQRSILFTAPLDEYLNYGVVQFEIEQPDFKAFLITYSDGRLVLMLSDDVDRDEDEQRRLVQQAIGRTGGGRLWQAACRSCCRRPRVVVLGATRVGSPGELAVNAMDWAMRGAAAAPPRLASPHGR